MHVHADILAVATHLSCLLRGNVIRANGYPFPKARVPFSRSTIVETNVNHPEYRRRSLFRITSLQFFRRAHRLLPSAAAAERSPCKA